VYCDSDPVGGVDPDGRDWQSIGRSFIKGAVVGAIVAGIVVLAAPVAVSGLVAIGISTGVAAGIVTTGIFIGGVAGAIGAGFSLYTAIRLKDWDQVAETSGGLIGGAIVGGIGGGGRRLGGMDGTPSPAPPMKSPIQMIKYEWSNVFKPKLGPPNLDWMGTKPTPASGGGALIGVGGGSAAVLL
jgi:hypothetical protein